AAGAPYRGAVPKGHAVRILTGALIPGGVDTVILQEDVTATKTHIAFAAGIRAGANTRKAGEDIEEGATALPAGRVLTPGDLALLTATGHRKARVHKRLAVGILSTGDELADPGKTVDASATYDANRPMLAALARRWGHKAIDLGIAPDDRDALRDRLDRAAETSHVIVTSGGASAGDEDHMSAILREEGQVQTWRIAIKPGRPLALGFWNGVPVIGMPGNPVAAFVCALVFARPALSVLAGGAWHAPRPLRLPAAFSKAKKPGRSEYLRARLNAKGEVEVFASEGSGRISGLSWSEGLVALGPEARTISPGDAVDYLPFGAFGI
ncbi:MAG: hypothetical protein KJN93_04625, partial [Alphaproteobacteria bacterium]|nr:hypothetical protein [Alphaproteobacteria bacterium]